MSTLIDVQDKINDARHLVEAVFMAASGIGDREHMTAIQTVCDVAEDRLQQAVAMLDKIRVAKK